jgi:hypothetical protein
MVQSESFDICFRKRKSPMHKAMESDASPLPPFATAPVGRRQARLIANVSGCPRSVSVFFEKGYNARHEQYLYS